MLPIIPLIFIASMMALPPSAVAQTTPKTKGADGKRPDRKIDSLESVYTDIRNEISSIKADPFDSNSKASRVSEIYRAYEGREILIPNSISRDDSTPSQNIGPLEYWKGILEIEFNIASALGHHGRNIQPGPFSLTKSFSQDTGGGRKVDNGTVCTGYTKTTGYVIDPVTPTTIKSGGFEIGESQNSVWKNDRLKISSKVSTDYARSLSSNIATYITLKEITNVHEYDFANGGSYTMIEGYCYAGYARIISAKIAKIRVVNNQSNTTLLSIEFTEHK